jgi:hypothetical protein
VSGPVPTQASAALTLCAAPQCLHQTEISSVPRRRRPRSVVSIDDCTTWPVFGLRWSRFSGQYGGLAKMDFGFDYAANFSRDCLVDQFIGA